MFQIPMTSIWDTYRVARKRAGASADPDFFNTRGLRLGKKGFCHHGERYFTANLGIGWAVYRLAEHEVVRMSVEFNLNKDATGWLLELVRSKEATMKKSITELMKEMGL